MKRSAAFVAVAVVLAAVFVRLGFWQLERRDERRAANAAVRAALARPPLDLAAVPSLLDSPDRAYRRAFGAGALDVSRERVIPQRSWRGSPGVGLLAPLVLDGGAEVWVDRGWAPSPDASTLDPGPWVERGRVRVEGFFRLPTPRERLALAGGAAPATPGPPALVLQQLPPRPAEESGSRPAAQARGAAPAPVLRRAPLPEPDDGPHLSYAVQWFSFAAIAVGGAAAWLLAQRRGGPAPRGPAPRGPAPGDPARGDPACGDPMRGDGAPGDPARSRERPPGATAAGRSSARAGAG